MTAGLAAAGLIGGLAAAVAAGMLFAACRLSPWGSS